MQITTEKTLKMTEPATVAILSFSVRDHGELFGNLKKEGSFVPRL